MSAGSNGGPAFPCEIGGDPSNDYHQTGNHTAQQYGMSLRDYFAAKAMAAYICTPKLLGDGEPMTEIDFAKLAYAQADAMLKARAS